MDQEQKDLHAQVTQCVEAYRDAIIQIAVDNDYSFDVVFNALAQVSSAFIFDFLLLSKGEINEDGIAAAASKLSLQTQAVASAVLDNMRKFAESEKLTAEAIGVAVENQASV